MYRARYRRIVWFFARVIASIMFWDVFLPRIGFSGWSAEGRTSRYRKSATRFRKLAINMGGVMIKVGQFLSTRVDMLPKEVTEELAGLQDEVPPVPFEQIQKVIETEFNSPLDSVFQQFEAKPLAAASLGQVHRASLLPYSSSPGPRSESPGRLYQTPIQVVVKVQRPDIESLIKTDLEALRTVGHWLQRFRSIRRRANIPALLDEFSKILYEEIDYLAEGRNAERFGTNFSDDPRVRVPKVYWTHSTVRVLTLENVYAIKITDYNAIAQAGIDRKEVASLLIDTYLQQIFVDSFFHADPHPGNLFIEPGNGIKPIYGYEANVPTRPRWQLTFVDFGMVGQIPPNLRIGLRELLISIGTRDSQRVVHAYQLMGILLPDADIVILERASSRIFERYWGKSMLELSNLSTRDLKEFLDEFRDLLYDLPFQIPQDLIFLARCVGILAGICIGLDPQFNIFQHLAPYTQKLIADEVRNNRKEWLVEIENLARGWISLPGKLDSLLAKLDRGEITIRNPEVSLQLTRLERAVRLLATGFVFFAFLIGGVIFFTNDFIIAASVFFGGAAISLVWIVWKNMISP